jgi:hypothetical protein
MDSTELSYREFMQRYPVSALNEDGGIDKHRCLEQFEKEGECLSLPRLVSHIHAQVYN